VLSIRKRHRAASRSWVRGTKGGGGEDGLLLILMRHNGKERKEGRCLILDRTVETRGMLSWEEEGKG